MNLSDNLKKIRKEHNLSQEQLAEKLGVSRQSVSKWESGTAYPEMEKMLQLCQLFNLNIDELLNQDVKEVNNTKTAKNNINKFIDDFLDYVTKTINLFCSLTFKEKIKCLFEQLIIIGVISLVLLIIGSIASSIFESIVLFMPDKIYYPIYHLFEAIYLLFCLIFTIVLVCYIFKIRYLDYYVFVKNEKEAIDVEENDKEENDEEIQETKEEIKVIEKPKVVIRDPKHSGYKFISGLLKCLLFFVKFTFACIGLAFCFSMIAFVVVFAISFIFIRTGTLFLGLVLFLLGCILINLVILVLIYNFIISRKSKINKLAIIFISSLISIGLGIGYMTIGISKFEFIDSVDSKYYVLEEVKYNMEKDLFFEDYTNSIEFVESENSDIKIVYGHSLIHNVEFTKVNNGYYITTDYNLHEQSKIIKEVIDNFNDKKLISYEQPKITLYTTKENIDILKSNLDKYYEEQRENRIQEIINDYQNRIDELNNEILVKDNKIFELENNCNWVE